MGSPLAKRATSEGVRVSQTPWFLGIDPLAFARLSLAALLFRPQIIHAHDSHALAIVRGLSWLLAAPPVVVATRRVDFHVSKRSPWRRATHVIAISDAIKGVLKADGLNPGEISVVHSGIDPAEVRQAANRPLDIRARLGLPAGTPLAVNVAALVGHKDQSTLIRAAAAARGLRPDLHWVIAGEGKLRGSLAAEIDRLGLRERVHLVGYIDEADALIREGDVFVMSSKEEGLGSVVLNALALEKPVVATSGGGLPEMLPSEALVQVGDADALARKVVAALDHRAPLPFPPQFTAAAMAAGVLAVYRSLT
jgi:glycosyltransferase involved in cell wall biosynthesis